MTLDFYHWFPSLQGAEMLLRLAALGGLMSLTWYARAEDREYKRKNDAREDGIARKLRIEDDAFASSWRRYAAVSVDLSFNLNNVGITKSFGRWYVTYDSLAISNDNFFVLKG